MKVPIFIVKCNCKDSLEKTYHFGPKGTADMVKEIKCMKCKSSATLIRQSEKEIQ